MFVSCFVFVLVGLIGLLYGKLLFGCCFVDLVGWVLMFGFIGWFIGLFGFCLAAGFVCGLLLLVA